MQSRENRTLILIPTYNEARNIGLLLEQVLALDLPGVDVLVIDDNSRDGTADIVSAYGAADPRITLMQRAGKLGLGTAYMAGMRQALELGYGWVIQMDADLSHSPEYLPDMCRLAKQHPVVIGSRYVPGGGSDGWERSRLCLSKLANIAARGILGLHPRDCTSGFRCYRRDVLAAIFASELQSEGFIFQVEMTYAVERLGFPIYELPITFRNRNEGQSKMAFRIVREGFATLLRLRLSTGRAPAPRATGSDVVIVTEFCPPLIGSDTRIAQLAQKLSDHSRVTAVVLPPVRALTNKLSPAERAVWAEHQQLRMLNGIPISRLPLNRLLRRAWAWKMSVGYALSFLPQLRQLTRELRRMRPGTVVLNYPSIYTGLLGHLAARLAGVQVVCDFNDLIAEYTLRQLPPQPMFIQRFVKGVQNYIVRNSDAVIVCTSYLGQYVDELLARVSPAARPPVLKLPNGVDLRPFRELAAAAGVAKAAAAAGAAAPGVSPGAHAVATKWVCGYAGRLDGWAGREIICEVARLAMAKGLPIEFRVAGAGGAALSHTPNLSHEGLLPPDEVPGFLAGCDCVMVPFPDDPVSHAASPLKLFEAMAIGRPVIASRVTGVVDVVEHGRDGLVVDNLADAWLGAITSLMDNTSLTRQIALSAGQSVENYDWRRLSVQFEGFLQEVGRQPGKRSVVA